MDTNQLNFSLRERTFLSTKSFEEHSESEPGQTLLITADPIGALLQKNPTAMSDHPISHMASQLALTISRFRDFCYFGTKISLVPAATTGQVDPAHISAPLAGTSNYMHPRDISNMIHYRRWVGGNFRVPSVWPTESVGTLTVTHAYSTQDSYDLDAAWLSDDRFNHALVSDGFTMFVRPLRATLETSAVATQSVLGFYDIKHASGISGSTTAAQQSLGSTLLSTGDVRPDSWMPNPFAGLIYSWTEPPAAGSGTMPEETGNEQAFVTDFSSRFPWYADVVSLKTYAPSLDVDSLLSLLRDRFRVPICILRLPPAYGSVFYYTLYMRHYFAVRRPYITNGVWCAGKIQRFVVTSSDALDSETGLRMMSECDDSSDEYRLTQMISPDPYGAADNADVLPFDDGFAASVFSTMVDEDDVSPNWHDPDLSLVPEEKEKVPVSEQKSEVKVDDSE